LIINASTTTMTINKVRKFKTKKPENEKRNGALCLFGRIILDCDFLFYFGRVCLLSIGFGFGFGFGFDGFGFGLGGSPACVAASSDLDATRV